MRFRKHLGFVLALGLVTASAQQTPSPAAAEWWRLTTALSNDSMQGRDTGSDAYERAAHYVAETFAASGLRPAGDDGTYFQRVAMHQIELDVPHSAINLLTPQGQSEPLRWLYETTLVPRASLTPSAEGKLIFVGYGASPADADLHGKIAVFFNNTPAGLSPEERARFVSARVPALLRAGAAAVVSIDNPAAIEPTHWPAAYARTVTLSTPAVVDRAAQTPVLRISAEAAPRLLSGAGVDPAKLLADGERGLPLSTVELKLGLSIHLAFTEKEISSPNILAILPGSDPRLVPEYVALSAHLDGYGFGTPVLGDTLYNGTLDDAAYVATLLEMAHAVSTQRASGEQRAACGNPGTNCTQPDQLPSRSLLFCIFTGEEKGLLGSAYFTQHPTVPIRQIVADLNLDQLRPIFPLKILTMEGIADSSLTESARAVAQQFHIELRPDHETERNLYRRADNYNFARVGVPIASFIFGYDPGTPEERTYRDWYASRYHKPQDDLATPIDWQAAVTFNRFYRALALAVANAPSRPAWLPGSPNAPRDAASAPAR